MPSHASLGHAQEKWWPIITAADIKGGMTMKGYRYLTGKDDAAFCHRVTAALNSGWQLYGNPTLTFDQTTGQVVCGQAITKDVAAKSYSPDMELGKL